MPREEQLRESSRWIAKAREDWSDAQLLWKAGSSSDNLIWLIQQSIEKSIKAILIREGIVFRKIHDLEKLTDLLPAHHELQEIREDLERLSLRAMQSRYPGEFDEIEDSQLAKALETGECVMSIMQTEFPEDGDET